MQSGDSWKLAFVKKSTVLGVEVSWIRTLLLLLLWLRLLLLLFPLMMSSTLYCHIKVKIIVEMVTMAAETNKNGKNTKCSLEVAALWFLDNSCLQLDLDNAFELLFSWEHVSYFYLLSFLYYYSVCVYLWGCCNGHIRTLLKMFTLAFLWLWECLPWFSSYDVNN